MLVDVSVSGGQPEALAPAIRHRPVWSPDGRWITRGGTTGVGALSRDGQTDTTIAGGTGSFIPVGWSSGGMNSCSRPTAVVRTVWPS